MPKEMIEKTAYYCEAVDRVVTRLTERYERQGDIDLSDVIHVARSVLRDIEVPAGIRYEFPVGIGETVKSACEDFDEDDNPITELVPYPVKGVAFYKGKQYVIDNCGEGYEIGTRYCILPERETSSTAERSPFPNREGLEVEYVSEI